MDPISAIFSGLGSVFGSGSFLDSSFYSSEEQAATATSNAQIAEQQASAADAVSIAQTQAAAQQQITLYLVIGAAAVAFIILLIFLFK